VTKVIQRLGRAGLVRSVRGPRGGSSLTGPPAEITLLQIYEAIEGPLTPLGCLLSKPLCKGGCCLLGGLLQEVSRSMHHHFAKTTLADAVTALREQECRV
jgi:Rrf2 family protein